MKRALVAAVVLVGAVVIDALPAVAHDPIILTDDQTEAASGPFLPDGTISFALYGSLRGEGDQRAFRVAFTTGDRLYLSMLIPDLSPENALELDQLPYLEVTDPTGASTTLGVTERVPFAEPFTGTNYIRLSEMVDVALQGVYTITIVGVAPARFTVSVGEKEVFGTPAEGVTDRSLGVEGVLAWYATPPEAAIPSTVPTTTSAAPSITAEQPTTTLADEDETSETKTGSAMNPGVVIVAVLLVGVAVVIAALRRRRR